MPRRLFVILSALGVLAVAASALDRSSLVYVAGATPNAPVVGMKSQTVCQGPIDLPDGAHFERVALVASPRTGALAVSVQDASGRVLGRGTTAAVRVRESRHGEPVTAAVGDIRSTRPLTVCVRGTGELYGAPGIGSRQQATLDGVPAGFDVGLRLERAKGVSLIGQLPDVAERTSLFKAGWVSPVSLGVLLVLLVLGVPAALLVVLRQPDTRSTQSHSPPEHSE